MTGYAENLSTGEALVVAEGESAKLDELMKLVEKDAPAYHGIEGGGLPGHL